MNYETRKAALASLREFTPRLRAAHTIVAFWSTTHNRTRYARVYGSI